MITTWNTIDLCFECYLGVVWIHRSPFVIVCSFCGGNTKVFRGIHFHVWDLNVVSFEGKVDGFLVVLPWDWHVLGDMFEEMLIQISRFVTFQAQILFVSCSSQLIWQSVMRLESAIIRLIELQLYLIDWRSNAVLLETNSFWNGLFKWLDIYVIRLNSHFMQIGCSFFMNDMIFLILVKRRVS